MSSILSLTSSSNPFASKSDIKLESLQDAKSLHSGSKLHSATLILSTGHRDFDRHQTLAALACDSVSTQFLLNCFDSTDCKEIEAYKTKYAATSNLDRIFWPDMVLQISSKNDQLEEMDLNKDSDSKFLFVHSLILKKCTFFDNIINECKSDPGTTINQCPIIKLSWSYKATVEILRFFYLREISVNIDQDEDINEISTIASNLRNEDLDFAITYFKRHSLFKKQEKLNPFKQPPIPKREFKRNNVSTKKRQANPKHKPTNKQSRKTDMNFVASNSQLMSRFLADTENIAEIKSESM